MKYAQRNKVSSRSKKQEELESNNAIHIFQALDYNFLIEGDEILLNSAELIVLRSKKVEKMADIENYIQYLAKEDYLKKLSKQKELSTKKIKQLPVSKICDIKILDKARPLRSGDVLIYPNTGEYSIFLQ
ncbi:MAG: hypothetical protein ACE5R3_02100 [Nitrosopumilaceae archaeon]